MGIMRKPCLLCFLIINLFSVSYGNAKTLTFPVSRQWNFEDIDPFKFWTSNGTYTIHFKGLSDDFVFSGKKSFKIDLTLNTATFVYWQIPMAPLPIDGDLSLTSAIRVSRGGMASLGSNFVLPQFNLSGVYFDNFKKPGSKEWVHRSLDLIAAGEEKADRLCKKYVYGGTFRDNVAIITDRVGFFIRAQQNTRLTVYIDAIHIQGNVSNITTYREEKRIKWDTASKNIKLKIENQISIIDKQRHLIDKSSDHLNQYKKLIIADRLIGEYKARGFLSPKQFNNLVEIASALQFINRHSDKTLGVYPWNCFSRIKILPDTFPVPAAMGNQIEVVTTKGEMEPFSFVLRSSETIKGLTLNTSLFRSDTDSIQLPKSSVRLKWVKCWYQANINSIRFSKYRFLVPELLLNDLDLVKVDTSKKKNFLKIYSDENYRYVDISSIQSKLPANAIIAEPDNIKPIDLPPKFSQQVWGTVSIPEETPPGYYRGEINIVSGQSTIDSINLSIRVLPFKLSAPVLDYCLYYRGKLVDATESSIGSEKKSSAQYCLELNDMKTHGVYCPTLYQRLDKHLISALKIRDTIGLNKENLYVLGTQTKLLSNIPDQNKLINDVHEWMKVKKRFGYRNLYIYGIDEAKGEKLIAQRQLWQKVKVTGAKIFVACYSGTYDAVGDLLDLPILGGGRFDLGEVEKWHNSGKKVFIYGNPQVGIENPYIYRHNYGGLLFLSGYDGTMNYAYQHGFGHIWNDFDHPKFRDHVFAYPLTEGLVPTIQWEGFREAVDDVRYISTLLSISKQQQPELSRWIEQQIKSSASPSELRSIVVRRILQALN